MGPVTQFPVSGSGGGGSTPITINNNSNGNLIKATGLQTTVEGISSLKYDGALTASTDIYISGSGNNLFLNGTDSTGSLKRYELVIEAGRLVVNMNPE